MTVTIQPYLAPSKNVIHIFRLGASTLKYQHAPFLRSFSVLSSKAGQGIKARWKYSYLKATDFLRVLDIFGVITLDVAHTPSPVNPMG